MKLALSILCENPVRKTGLTTLFHEFVGRARRLAPDIDWVVFAGPRQEWTVVDSRVQVVRDYPANDRLAARLFADHFRVPAHARRLGAEALLTVGFAPLRGAGLPNVLHIFSLQHLSADNRVGGLRARYRRLAVERGLRTAALVITNSRVAAEGVLRVEPACRERLLVSYEGLPHEQFFPSVDAGRAAEEAARLKAAFDVAPGFLLWVSNFYAYKQADLLLAAYARLPRELRARRPLVMVGGGWEGGMEAAGAAARALGIEEEVKFLGWIGDEWLAPLYRQARGFCLASREETFGRCVVEAMACGAPAVVNAIPIMEEVTGGHALLVDFQDTAASARALEAICTDDALHARLSASGREWVSRYSFDKLTTERLAAIRAALSRQAAS